MTDRKTVWITRDPGRNGPYCLWSTKPAWLWIPGTWQCPSDHCCFLEMHRIDFEGLVPKSWYLPKGGPKAIYEVELSDD